VSIFSLWNYLESSEAGHPIVCLIELVSHELGYQTDRVDDICHHTASFSRRAGRVHRGSETRFTKSSVKSDCLGERFDGFDKLSNSGICLLVSNRAMLIRYPAQPLSQVRRKLVSAQGYLPEDKGGSRDLWTQIEACACYPEHYRIHHRRRERGKYRQLSSLDEILQMVQFY
jgi:hypothetical protein